MDTGKRDRINRIFSLFSGRRYSPRLEKDVQSWLAGGEDEEEKRQASFRLWENSAVDKADGKTEDALARVNQKLGIRKSRITFVRCMTYVAAAFVPLFLISVALMFFIDKEDRNTELVTANGETLKAILPDGTEVKLQAGSRLVYPGSFAPEGRVVQLNGEAFFSVTKDENRPFTVEANGLKVEVHGTEFNLRAYSEDEQVVAILKSGKIDIITAGKVISLHPGDRYIYDRVTGKAETNRIEGYPKSVIEDAFAFDDASLAEILRSVERRFNVRFRQVPQYLNGRYTVRFHENDGIDSIVEMLDEMLESYTFKRSGSEIILQEK